MIASVFLYTLPLDNTKGRLAALWMAKFFLGPYIVSLALNVANIAGHTKKVTVQAIIFIAYCSKSASFLVHGFIKSLTLPQKIASNIIAPQFFKASQAPLYAMGMGAILAGYVLAIICISLYGAYCYWENCRRARLDSTRGDRVHVDTDFKDLTDRQNIHFHYVW